MNNISGNIEAVFLRLGTTNLHHKRNKMTSNILYIRDIAYSVFYQFLVANNMTSSLL